MGEVVLSVLLTLSAALASTPAPPAAILQQVLAEIPNEARLQALHWDGRRVWISGDGLTSLTEDGRRPTTAWPVPAGDALTPEILSGSSMSPPLMSRMDSFVMGLAAPPLQVDPSAPLVLQAADVWLDTPDYAASLVHIRGMAHSAKSLRRLEQVASLSPCLRDVKVHPHDQDRLPIAFTLTARSLGDLRSTSCAPTTTATATPAELEMTGSWSDVWTALSAPSPAPVDTLSMWANDDQITVKVSYFGHAGSESGKDAKAIANHIGTPTDSLLADAKLLPPLSPDTLGYDILGGDAPRGVATEDSQIQLVEDHKTRLHEVMGVLDSTMVDLQGVRLQEVRQSHRQVAELVFDIRMTGPEAQIEANLKELVLPGVSVVPLRADEVRLPPTDGKLPEGAETLDATLIVSVPVLPGAPRSPTWQATALPVAPPRDLFSRGPGWQAKKASLDELIADKSAPLRPKAWHIAYLGHIGTAVPRGLVQTPDGEVLVVRTGDPLGDAWAKVNDLDDEGLELRLEYEQIDGTEIRREVDLPAPALPPDEAPAPSASIAQIDADALASLRSRFPDAKPINLDLVDIELAALFELFTEAGTPVTFAGDLGTDLPTVSIQSMDRGVGDVLAELQVVLLDHGLVFDEARVLRRDAATASELRSSLLAGASVSTSSLPPAPLKMAAQGEFRVHISPSDPLDVLRLLKVAHTAVGPDLQIHLHADDLSTADMLGAIDARLSAAGWQLAVTEDSVLMLKK